MSLLEWVAAPVAMAGAWLLGYRRQSARWAGWACFLCSNVLWISWGISLGAWGFVAMQGLFVITSVRGLIVTSREEGES